MKEVSIEKIIRQLIKATNAFDIEAALTLFAADAVIDDVSVGEKFKTRTGVRRYLDQYFIGYNTVSKIEYVKLINDLHAVTQLDFTGDFGHETGSLKVTINKEGLIIGIDAHLD
ncbi:MAG: hypothetical protein JWO58_220 [Chitinophagaceae bacterium]|nr:hypothetical protein [Chitinophagaceae bacterium]